MFCSEIGILFLQWHYCDHKVYLTMFLSIICFIASLLLIYPVANIFSGGDMEVYNMTVSNYNQQEISRAVGFYSKYGLIKKLDHI